MQFPEIPFEAPESPVSFDFEDVQFDLPDNERLAAWLQEVARQEGKAFESLSYIFCSDEYLRGINVEYLDHDYYTDVITFPYASGAINGDVFISSERVADNARDLGVAFEHELCRVLVHGLLHLAGHGDETDEQEAAMRALEDKYLRLMYEG